MLLQTSFPPNFQISKLKWLRVVVPTFIAQKFVKHALLKKTFMSFSWMLMDQFFKIFCVLLITVLLARTYGPEQFGYLQYLMAFSALFLSIGQLGLATLTVKHISQKIASPEVIIGSSLLIRIIGHLIAVAACAVAMLLLRPQDQLTQLLVSLLMIGYCFQSVEVFEFWLQSQLRVKRLVIYKALFLMTTTAVNVIGILNNIPIHYIVILLMTEQAILSLASIIAFIQDDSKVKKLQVHFQYIRLVLVDALPLFLSAVCLLLYAKGDQLLINYFLGSSLLGQYVVALTVIEGLAILPMVMIRAVSPTVLISGVENYNRYLQQLSTLYQYMTVICAVVLLGIVLIVSPALTLLYGNAYSLASIILIPLSLRIIFSFFGVARMLFITHENLFRYDLFTKIVGLALHLLLSVILLPIMGIYGVIVASIISLLCSTFILDIFHPRLRINLILEVKGVATAHQIITAPFHKK